MIITLKNKHFTTYFNSDQIALMQSSHDDKKDALVVVGMPPQILPYGTCDKIYRAIRYPESEPCEIALSDIILPK